MGFFSRFENKAEDVIEGSGGRGRGGIEPVKLAKRAVKEMDREKMVGVGHEYAPTLYNILVSPEDDAAMNGYYPSLAGEIETYLTGQGAQHGLVFDCPPLVRFIVDDGLKRGKFDIIAESVSPAIISELRHEEMVRYGIEREKPQRQPRPEPRPEPQPEPQQAEEEPLPDDLPVDATYDEPGFDDDFAFEEVQNLANEPLPVDPQPVPAAAETVMLTESAPEPSVAYLYNIKRATRHQLRNDRTIVGRENACDVIIPDPSVSRRHAEILHNENGWVIRDTGSTNGLIVNGSTVTQSRLYDGDIIELGTTQLEFQEG